MAKGTILVLSNRWTIEQAQELVDMTDEDQLSQILTNEINGEILAKLHAVQGWYRTDRPREGWCENDVREWLKHNCQHGYHLWSGGCMLRDQNEAVLFGMVWG